MRDTSDFDANFDELALLAYRTAYRILGSPRDAEDATQDAMARALLRWPQIADHARPWICRVAANLAIDQVRRNTRHRSWLRRGSSPTQVPYEQTSLAFERVDLQRALTELPRRQREVLVLRYIADFSEADVARELGLALPTVKTHARRALATLRSNLAERVPEQESDDVRTP